MSKRKKVGIPFREGDFLLSMCEPGRWLLRRIEGDTVDAGLAGQESLPGLADRLRRLASAESDLDREAERLESEIEAED